MKIKRHSKIVELIKENDIETQEELADRLNDSGFKVTQATISRDIRELRLTKIATADGHQKYAVLSGDDNKVNDKYISVFKTGVASMDYAQNMVIIKTLNGMAMAVASSIDSMNNTEIVGSIAGDDTILCITKDEQKALRLLERFKAIIKPD